MMNTYDVWIERRDGTRARYRMEAERGSDAAREVLRQHARETGDPIDGESCWVRQIIGVATAPETRRT